MYELTVEKLPHPGVVVSAVLVVIAVSVVVEPDVPPSPPRPPVSPPPPPATIEPLHAAPWIEARAAMAVIVTTNLGERREKGKLIRTA
jgi:hypothetical protein